MTEDYYFPPISPQFPPAKFSCKTCDYNTGKRSDYSQHLLTAKHKRITLDYHFPQNSRKIPAAKFSCKTCDYNTGNRRDYRQHLLTAKHTRITFPAISRHFPPFPAAASVVQSFVCACGKKYKFKQGLSKHKHACEAITPVDAIDADATQVDTIVANYCDDPAAQNNIVIEIVNQHNEFKELIAQQNRQIIELIKDKHSSTVINNVTNNNNTNNTNTNHNKFNLNVFLNEKCKDALNIDEFLNTIVIQLTDLEESLALGYSDGLSKIISTRLNALDLHKRPIHCSDFKREIMYIKDGDVWEKDNEDRIKIKKAICAIERKTIGKLAEWPKMYPNSLIGSHQDNTTYMKIVRQVSGGDLNKAETNLNKIIKNIAQEAQIDKKPQ